MELAKKLRPITHTDAIESYKDLKDYDCKMTPGLSRMGLKTLDMFFLPYRLKAKTKHHLSFYQAMRDPEIVAHLTQLVQRYKKKAPSEYETVEELLRAQYSVFQLYYGTINQFRPSAAKWAYCTLGAKKGILDFSAGWGGRALAAASLGIPYYGFDANVNLRAPYKKLLNLIHDVDKESMSPILLTFQPSETVDFSKYKYDLVFTSPPYFMLEEYEEMPAYEGKRNFLQRFFIPVVSACWKHLLPGGHLALNMPEEMYEALRGHLPPLTKTLKLPLGNRHPTNAVKRQGFGKEDEERHELIYVWKKPQRTPRR